MYYYVFRLHDSCDHYDNNDDNDNRGDDEDEYNIIRDDPAKNIDLDVISQSHISRYAKFG